MLLEDRILAEISVANSSLITVVELLSVIDKQFVSTVVCHLTPDTFIGILTLFYGISIFTL